MLHTPQLGAKLSPGALTLQMGEVPALSQPQDHPSSSASSKEASRLYLPTSTQHWVLGRGLVLLPPKSWAGAKGLLPARQPVGQALQPPLAQNHSVWHFSHSAELLCCPAGEGVVTFGVDTQSSLEDRLCFLQTSRKQPNSQPTPAANPRVQGSCVEGHAGLKGHSKVTHQRASKGAEMGQLCPCFLPTAELPTSVPLPGLTCGVT